MDSLINGIKKLFNSDEEICEICNYTCYTKRFQQNFINWSSNNDVIDNFIKNTQLSAHGDVKKALGWIPYYKFYDIEDITKDRYYANWIDGNMIDWDSENQNWKREGRHMIVELKKLNDPKSIEQEAMDEMSDLYGITWDRKTKTYLMVVSEICKKCNVNCAAKLFQPNFKNWTSGNNDIDKRFGNVYKANWIDGNMIYWNSKNKDWRRKVQNMAVALKSLNNTKNVTLEYMNEITLYNNRVDDDVYIRLYGITQDPETKDYMMVLDYAESGSLRHYLNVSYNELNWESKINCLYCIASGLENIHKNELILEIYILVIW
uniref:Protein kinase domain-containing protein n=1 Tax=Rhizophagus irregularis (strain DAOM 181602 / DAOM 197198 / MUCL 43194) TaxID=747089 RepID=U9UH74_RHIID